MAPLVEVVIGLGGGVLDDWVLAGSIDAADLVREVDLCFAARLLQPLDPDLVEIGVVYVVLTEEAGEDVGRKVLEDVQLRKSVITQHSFSDVLTAGTTLMSPYPYNAIGLTSSCGRIVKLFVLNHSSPDTVRLSGTPFCPRISTPQKKSSLWHTL